MAETSLHLATQASRVFLSLHGNPSACKPTPNALREGVTKVAVQELFTGNIPRHTGQNAITEGDLECILTKLLRTE